MTREEAIKMLEYIRTTGNGENPYKHDAQSIAIDMAIEALEQEPCEDAISRQDALDCLTATGLKKFDFILDARDKIKNLPPVTAQPKIDVAKWEKFSDGTSYWYACSVCHNKIPKNRYGIDYFSSYCPACGLKMESEVG